MWICKVCRTANEKSGACRRCGFDPGKDYESYPTAAFFDCSAERSVKGLADDFLRSVDPDLFLCGNCGGSRYYYSASGRRLICCDCGWETVLKAPVLKPPRETVIKIVPVSIGFNHVIGVKKDGSVEVAGNNNRGQCDVGEFREIRAVSAGFLNTLGLKKDGTVVSAGFSKEEKATIDTWTDIIAVSAGRGFGAGLRKDGTVCLSCEFRDDPKQVVLANGAKLTRLANRSLSYLKDVQTWTDVVSITAHEKSLYGVRSDGTVLSCQSFESPSKLLSLIANWKDIADITVNNTCVFGLKRDGTVVSTARLTGGASAETLREISRWKDIRSLSASANQLVGLKADGLVVSVNITDSAPFSDRFSAGNDFTGSISFGLKAMSAWHDIRAIYSGETYTLGIQSNGSVLIAGITTLDKQLSGWKNLLIPEKAV